MATESATLSVVNKRIRSLRKKLNRITQMETQQISTLNSEQIQTLQSKPFLLSTIDELEKLRLPLSHAVTTQIRSVTDTVVSDLIRLVYVGSLGLDEELVGFGAELVGKSSVGELSHKETVDKCVEKAKMWVEGLIGGDESDAYAGLREKLAKVVASEYFTSAPVVKAPLEVVGNDTSFQMPMIGSIISPVTAIDPVESSALEFQQEGVKHSSSPENTKPEDEAYDVEGLQEVKQFISPETEKYGDEVVETLEVHQGGSEVENMSKIQTRAEGDSELNITDTEDDQNPWNHVSKKSHQNHRRGRGALRGHHGNGLRGGRGGYRGGYQNGHTKAYEQTGRNNNYRGRGGRGRGGNNAHEAFASHAASAS